MQQLPKNNLAYPVLITVSTDSMGTGCYIVDDGIIYLSTAKHVLFDENNDLRGTTATLKSYTEDLNENDYTQIDLDLNLLLRNTNILFHNMYDVCVIKLLTISATGNESDAVEGVLITNESSQGIVGIDINKTSKVYSEVLISNNIFIFGYPVSIGLQNLPQINYSMPLLRKGIVAGKNDSNKTIILDCPIYQGNSGGPVIELEDEGNQIIYRLIGLVSQFIPVEDRWENKSFGLTNIQWSNSGYSVAMPVDFIKDLLPQFPNTGEV